MANTEEGKAISARNATTHGLFCRQTVLPHLGENPEAYKQLLDGLLQELPPRNLMERQYIELWADASWKMRRLSRLEAQVWEEDGMDTKERLAQMERVLHLQATLRRQLDKAVRMMGRDVAELYGARRRRNSLQEMNTTEEECRKDRLWAKMVNGCDQFVAHSEQPALPASLAPSALDNAAPEDASSQNCQNEPVPLHPHEKVQNELAPARPRSRREPPNPLPSFYDGLAEDPWPDGDRWEALMPPAPPERVHARTQEALRQFARTCAEHN